MIKKNQKHYGGSPISHPGPGIRLNPGILAGIIVPQ